MKIAPYVVIVQAEGTHQAGVYPADTLEDCMELANRMKNAAPSMHVYLAGTSDEEFTEQSPDYPDYRPLKEWGRQ